MNDRDVILMTIYIALSIYLLFFFWSVTGIIYTSFSWSFYLSIPLGFVVAMLSIHTVDHWVVFDTIYIHSGAPISCLL
jgi:hypothetical protein